jgi:CRP/FNR family transcriptional regulator
MSVAAEVVRSIPLFGQLTDDEIALVAQGTVMRTYRGGDIIACADEPCRELYILRSGTVRIFRTAPDGREQVLLVTKPGDFFGGAPIFCGCPLPSTVQAQEDTQIISVPAELLLSIVERYPHIAMRILGLCCARLRRLTSLAAELSTKNVVRRLAWLLLDVCADRIGHADYCCRLTEEQIAARLGATQETVSRALARLREYGAIETRRQEIRIRDLTALRRVATGLEPVL